MELKSTVNVHGKQPKALSQDSDGPCLLKV